MNNTLVVKFRGGSVAIGYRGTSRHTAEWWFEGDKFKDVKLKTEEFHTINDMVLEMFD